MHQTLPAFRLLENIIPDECPELTDTLLQVKRLHQAGSQSVVAAIGDYNVGKSSLLNTLIGEDIFAVADRRETRQLAQHMAGGICWLDTPGLDADLTAGDDRHAHSARHQADVLLFLHNASNGELSPKQLAQLQQLQQLPKGPHLQLVLTRIDECPPVALAKICARIQGQVEDLPILSVSSQRYRAGIAQQQPKLMELSGIPALNQRLADWSSQLSAHREQQKKTLTTQLRCTLQTRREQEQRQLTQLQQQHHQRQIEFSQQWQSLMSRLAACAG
jgi:tRNA U34 5-carboxymethylaminomethyl modifying GTPase MnmE/TrmE